MSTFDSFLASDLHLNLDLDSQSHSKTVYLSTPDSISTASANASNGGCHSFVSSSFDGLPLPLPLDGFYSDMITNHQLSEELDVDGNGVYYHNDSGYSSPQSSPESPQQLFQFQQQQQQQQPHMGDESHQIHTQLVQQQTQQVQEQQQQFDFAAFPLPLDVFPTNATAPIVPSPTAVCVSSNIATTNANPIAPFTPFIFDMQIEKHLSVVIPSPSSSSLNDMPSLEKVTKEKKTKSTKKPKEGKEKKEKKVKESKKKAKVKKESIKAAAAAIAVAEKKRKSAVAVPLVSCSPSSVTPSSPSSVTLSPCSPTDSESSIITQSSSSYSSSSSRRSSSSVDAADADADQYDEDDQYDNEDDLGLDEDDLDDDSLSSDVDGLVKGLIEESGQKRKRLARKAELARLSRKRKKTKLSDLEQQVERLQEELERVRSQHKKEMAAGAAASSAALAAATASVSAAIAASSSSAPIPLVTLPPHSSNGVDESKNLSMAIQQLVEASQSNMAQTDPKTLNVLIDNLVQVHQRKSVAADLSLNSLGSLLTPSMPIQFLSWLMSQNDKFTTDDNGLWNTLWQQELHLDQQQKQEIMSLRTTIKKQHAYQTEVAKAYKKLNLSLRKHLHQENENLDRVRAILTNQQLVQYVEWVTKYGSVCVKIHV